MVEKKETALLEIPAGSTVQKTLGGVLVTPPAELSVPRKGAVKVKIHDIRLAVLESTDNENSTLILSLALQTVLPILKRIARRQKFWLRWGMNALIRALEEYLKTVRGVA